MDPEWRLRRAHLRDLNVAIDGDPKSKPLDSSLKRHTALIKRMRQSIGTDNRDQVLKDIDQLTLEKYIDEIASAAVEGIARCKTEKDVWSAVEVVSALHRRFPSAFTPSYVALISTAIAAPSRASLAILAQDQRDKEDAARVTRQRPVLRVSAELALVRVIQDAPGRSGGEWIMKAVKELLSNDPSLSSLPLLSVFLKYYARPFLGITPSAGNSKQISSTTEPGSLSETAAAAADVPTTVISENEELVEKEIRDRFKKMCEGYFDTVCKKLVKEHNKLQEQDKRNHEAYIRSGEIFEDRQQAYEKMTKGYEKLLAACQTLSDLLNLPLPPLPTSSQKSDAAININAGQSQYQLESDDAATSGGKWEDDEEKKFYEDLFDLKDCVPGSMLGLSVGGKDKEGKDGKDAAGSGKDETEEERRKGEEEDVKRLEREMEGLRIERESETPEDGEPIATITSPPRSPEVDTGSLPNGHGGVPNGSISAAVAGDGSAPTQPELPASQLLTALLARLPETTNKSLVDQAAVDFAFMNSKAARKRLVKFLGQVPKNRTDLLPHYARFVATLNRYMPDVGSELVSVLEEEFRYLQRKRNVVKELAEVRNKNITFLSALTKFRIVPPHLILHIFKVFLDDFSGVNVENVALLLEGCGRFLMRDEETRERMVAMVELMRRKQSMQHFDQRQILLLENAYYQCNPPERGPRQEKERTPIEMFIRHLVHDVLIKKTIDKVLRLLRKLDWEDPVTYRTLFKVFTKPWKIKYGHISLLAMLTYDLQRYHPAFAVAVVDQVLEDVRSGLEQNIFKFNQQRVATIKYLGELYIYRLIGSGIIFDTLWSLTTFGHAEGRPLPGDPSPIDALDDFFRVRLVCTLLDTCGMCFDRGSQKRKLDNFITFFQLYVLCKDERPIDIEFMISDSIEALRPKLALFKTFEEAASVVDEMFSSIAHNPANNEPDADGDGDESDGAADGSGDEQPTRRTGAVEDEDQHPDDETVSDRPASPDTVVVLSAPEYLGPTEDAAADFDKELAKMMIDSAAESRKVDRKTAMALWDSAVTSGVRKKKGEDADDDDGDLVGGDSTKPDDDTMKFTVLSKRGNKQHTRQLGIPMTSMLAVHTRSAQLQDKVEQQHLKQLVLNYEQREEVEEMKALESNLRTKGIRFRNS